MAPDSKLGVDKQDGFDQTKGPDTSAAEAALKARLSRKRTKSGCLTCRKRRIKCGEEQPVCRNCIKSKRHCEGYNQRVVFKPPTFDYRPTPHGGAHITFQAGSVPGPATPYETELIYPEASFALQPQLRPRPVEQFASNDQQQSGLPEQTQTTHHHTHVNLGPQFIFFDAPPARRPPSPVQRPLVAPPDADKAPQYPTHMNEIGAVPTIGYSHTGPASNGPAHPQPVSVSGAAQHHGHVQLQGTRREYPEGDDNATYKGVKQESYLPERKALDEAGGGRVSTVYNQPRTWESNAYVLRPELCQPIDYQAPYTGVNSLWIQPQVSAAPLSQTVQNHTPDFHHHEANVPISNSPTYMLSQAAVETVDDDYYDVHTDEEMDDTSSLAVQGYGEQHKLSNILGRNHITIQELQTRRYDTFIYDGMLDHYRVDEHANPLKNPATARVFAHFISVTGPSLSIFERHPRNTSVLFTEGHIPFSQQGLWTYTMPLAALRNQGLLHSMLAIASLHIARLTGASATPSMQHYAWALKRIHHRVGHAKKRLNLTTIAASMLLGFYEIMTADHMKWNTHLAGSKQLIIETDFVTMMKQFRRMKAERITRFQYGRRLSEIPPASPQDDILDQIPDIDERMVSMLVGREVRYGHCGHVTVPESCIPQELDLSKFEILKDLYWWYCKQDAYQSIISGNPLLMDYSRWANCPPRAPLGRPDAVYGSFDHLMLLLARIADFVARDRRRKLQQMEANGGQWRPAPGMDIPRPPQPPSQPNAPPALVSAHTTIPMQGQSGLPVQPPPVTSAVPAFYGMAPPPRTNVQMPSSYIPANGIRTPPRPASGESIDLHTATETALKEHTDILAALQTLSLNLGEAFQPLSSEYQPAIESPFGPARVYRTFDIGCLWAVYNMAVMITIRSHPHMPPAAHMAAGIAAKQTAPYAQEIGRIAAGIVPGPPDQPLNPSLGAALCDSCMPSFFAAVQYQDPHQRHATVTRIFNIAQRTGWGTAEVIANGCETSWVKAAAAGRGPPYQRIGRNQRSHDSRVNGSWERVDPNAVPDGEDDSDRRLIKTNANARLNWAIGILASEEDVG